MRFQVPQFIDIEDKIFGPFTFKQFLYLFGAAGASYVIYRLLPLWLAILFILPIAALALALAFYKINSRPFISILYAWFVFLFQKKLYIWKKEPKKIEQKKAVPAEEKKTGQYLPRLSGSKLKDLAWGLDVMDLTKG